jgi:transcription elongation factor
MRHYLCLCVAVTGMIAFASSSQAGKIDVVNENHKSLTIKIEAEGDSSAISRREISGDQHSTFEVNAQDLNGKSYYSIKGDVNAFTPGDKCQNLSIEKNYKVTFQDDKVGTTCIAEEVKKIG